jgi:hypothetical protein
MLMIDGSTVVADWSAAPAVQNPRVTWITYAVHLSLLIVVHRMFVSSFQLNVTLASLSRDIHL